MNEDYSLYSILGIVGYNRLGDLEQINTLLTDIGDTVDIPRELRIGLVFDKKNKLPYIIIENSKKEKVLEYLFESGFILGNEPERMISGPLSPLVLSCLLGYEA